MIRGREFLEIVDALEDLDTEAAMRTQIGRLYYATFLEVRTWCELHLGYSRIRLAREHQALADAVASVEPSLESDMRYLRRARNAADYDEFLSVQDVRELKRRAQALTQEILQRLT